MRQGEASSDSEGQSFSALDQNMVSNIAAGKEKKDGESSGGLTGLA